MSVLKGTGVCCPWHHLVYIGLFSAPSAQTMSLNTMNLILYLALKRFWALGINCDQMDWNTSEHGSTTCDTKHAPQWTTEKPLWHIKWSQHGVYNSPCWAALLNVSPANKMLDSHHNMALRAHVKPNLKAFFLQIKNVFKPFPFPALAQVGISSKRQNWKSEGQYLI